jgi:hypothetical protein
MLSLTNYKTLTYFQYVQRFKLMSITPLMMVKTDKSYKAICAFIFENF